MPRIHVPLAEKVAAALRTMIDGDEFDDGDFVEGQTVERVNLPVDVLETSNVTKLVVFPGERSTGQAYRKGSEKEYRVIVALMEKIATDGDAEAQQAREDELIGLGEAIEDAMERTAFDINGYRAVWTEGEAGGAPVAPFLPEVLLESTQFTAIIPLTYTVVA